ncbi:OmpW family outer membrane protein [Flammeovirga aprica]|uniref:Outer membrane beta-barrel protein n=1 Tax=Flammeovirga aprica JL-4 TaxID=694437 RepID=A0A7X9RYQ4_9BACT|nr:OmpW family outer membrane protein [Flammeovirga aprica]NME71166.1 outer membrane beta-barrel protein [Flammeovirga aprica JL-4]
MKKILSILITLVVISGGSALAQENIISLTYSMAAPAGNTADFTGDASFRGGTFDYRHFINPNMSVGFSAGFQRFYEHKGFTTQPIGDGHISGQNYTYINEIPLMATYHYYFGLEGGVRPYVGGGIGAAHFEYSDQIGSVAWVDKQWHFKVAPEVGVLVPIGRTTYFHSNVKYNYAFEANSIPSQSYWSLNIGFAFDL